MGHEKVKKHRILKPLIIILIAAALVWQVLIPYVQYQQRQSLPIPQFSKASQSLVSANGLSSAYAILVRQKDGKILMDKNAEQKIYPASMTKMMTVIVALKKLPFPAQRITLTDDIFEQMKAEEASMAGFSAGERVRAIDLMYGALLPSGGECAIGLAKAAAGSESAFADMMNQQAQKIGMKDTHFVNATGLHSKEQYTTAKDMALLADYALGDATFRKIFTTHTYRTSIFDNKHFGGISFSSTLVKSNVYLNDKNILGGKTGFTDEAGYCLASLAKVAGEEYILVTADAPQNGNFQDAVEVYRRL